MKKIIPVIALLGTSALIVGMSTKPTETKKETFSQNINAFENDFSKYASINNSNIRTSLNKYTLSLEENLDDITNQTLTSIDETISNETLLNNSNTTALNEFENDDNQNDEETSLDDETNLNNLSNEDVKEESIEQISTLYSLSNDIEESCDEFCELKNDVSNAILETQNLIKKIQEKEIELTSEQRLFITQQAQQLKNLGRQLSGVTTELSFNLSDLNQLMSANNQNIDNLSLKYLIVLDNLVNGNEMLQSGLNSLNLINQMINMNSSTLPPNNQGRILYGFQQNNNPPIIKDYYINENGELINNQQSENNSNQNNQNETSENTEESKPVNESTNIDTYKNTNLNSNLDTYNNTNLPRNIDSFFNTALLDNEFMYGNGNMGYGYAGINQMYGANPNMTNYVNYENINRNSINSNQNTQDVEKTNKNFGNEKEKKRFRLKKNIDTFKDENEPDIKTKMGNIKNAISEFFSKFNKSDLDDKIDNPIYRFDANKNEEK